MPVRNAPPLLMDVDRPPCRTHMAVMTQALPANTASASPGRIRQTRGRATGGSVRGDADGTDEHGDEGVDHGGGDRLDRDEEPVEQRAGDEALDDVEVTHLFDLTPFEGPLEHDA